MLELKHAELLKAELPFVLNKVLSVNGALVEALPP